ncbi:MAG: hypothetical protein ACK6DW_11025 [Betaproteobacteria bacterium]
MDVKPLAVLTALVLFLASGSISSFAADAPAVVLTAEEKLKADELDRATLLATKEAAAINAKAALAKAKLDAATPATAEGVTAPTGTATGANAMTFAMYIASLQSLEFVAQAVCTDLHTSKVQNVFVTNRDVGDAVAKNRALFEGRDRLARSLDAATKKVGDLRDALKKSDAAASAPVISAASVNAIASGIDVAAGLVKGVAGLAAFFKTERTIAGADNLLTAADVAGSLSMCKGGDSPRPQVRNLDADLVALSGATKALDNEFGAVAGALMRLENVLAEITVETSKLATERARAESARADADAARVKAEAKGLEAESALARAEIALVRAEAAADKVETAVAKAEIAQAKATIARSVTARDRARADFDRAKLELVAADARKPATLDEFVRKAAALVTQAQAFLDTAYQVDATSGLSPLIVAAQLRVVSDAATGLAKIPRLQLSLLRSSGYSLTTKRLLLSDRVDYAGGVSVRAAVTDDTGNATFDRIYFHESGWIRADLKSTGTVLKRQNF